MLCKFYTSGNKIPIGDNTVSVNISNVNFRSLINILNIKYLSVEIKLNNDNIKYSRFDSRYRVYNSDNYFQFNRIDYRVDLNFIRVENDVNIDLTPCFHEYRKESFNVRISDFWAKEIFEFLGNDISEDRPSEGTWIYSNENYEGVSACKYYNIDKFGDIFESAIIQRAEDFEDEYHSRLSFVMYKLEDIFNYNDNPDQKYISILHDDYQQKKHVDEIEKRRQESDESDFYDLRNKKGIYDPNSWMDNPEDYWNID